LGCRCARKAERSAGKKVENAWMKMCRGMEMGRLSDMKKLLLHGNARRSLARSWISGLRVLDNTACGSKLRRSQRPLKNELRPCPPLLLLLLLAEG
jgi:hypothetical protein